MCKCKKAYAIDDMAKIGLELSRQNNNNTISKEDRIAIEKVKAQSYLGEIFAHASNVTNSTRQTLEAMNRNVLATINKK